MTDSYFFEWQREGKTITEPVRLQQVRSVITSPTDNADVDAGQLTIRGVGVVGRRTDRRRRRERR